MRHIGFMCVLIIVMVLLFFGVYYMSVSYETNRGINPANPANPVQTALITGGARGIGRAYATLLLENNYKVVILDKLNAVKAASELRVRYGTHRVLGIHCDITDFSAYNKAFEEANRFSDDGVVDILILNAAIIDPMFSNIEELIRTNLTSPIYSTELYVKKITSNLSRKAQKPCQIVVTGSLASFKPIDLALSPIYDASKSGISQFVRSLKPIARRYNFRINALCPMTMVNTELVKPLIRTYTEKIGTYVYLNSEGRGGMMEPEDVAQGLMRVINNTSYNGDLISVDTGNNHYARLEPLDEFGAYDEYGIWNEDDSYLTRVSVNRQLNKLLNNHADIWSYWTTDSKCN
jgi:NAD(P)-dependent dehydrogenase (short-subunit alcohol dehydrogenase family)